MKRKFYINMWSGPRNVSTALMYSFAQRDDTRVVDEPFYAHYLLQSGAMHPGRSEVLDSQPKDARIVLDNLFSTATDKRVLFIKNMAHHMINLGEVLDELVTRFSHFFLIRDPKDMIQSLDKTLPNPSLRDTAYPRQFELFEIVKSRGLPLVVLDAYELLKDPPSVLRRLCRKLGIPFQESMLSWREGPIPEDGIWAKHWYQRVHDSTGFKPGTPKEGSLPKRLRPLYDQCKPIYDKMFVHAIKV
ncbi:MAG: sulfotransferase family protein [Balneolaceae bacterium]|jgi:hypothetical protein